MNISIILIPSSNSNNFENQFLCFLYKYVVSSFGSILVNVLKSILFLKIYYHFGGSVNIVSFIEFLEIN